MCAIAGLAGMARTAGRDERGTAQDVLACAGCGRVTSVQLFEVDGVRAGTSEVVWLCARCDDPDGWADAQHDAYWDARLEARRQGD